MKEFYCMEAQYLQLSISPKQVKIASKNVKKKPAGTSTACPQRDLIVPFSRENYYTMSQTQTICTYGVGKQRQKVKDLAQHDIILSDL